MTVSTYTRRDFLRIAGVGVATAALPASLFAAETRKPNIVVILSDDHGYAEMGCQGCKDIPTPNIDSIARNGIRFTDGYVSCPVCSPSRAGLLTGRYQQRFGHECNLGPAIPPNTRVGLPTNQKTMADYLKAEGYATGVMGKWHLGKEPDMLPMKRGFDEYFGFLGAMHPYLKPGVGWNAITKGTQPFDEKEYLTYAIGREAVSFIERHKKEPFFLYLPFNAVHVPLEAPVRLKDAFPEIGNPKRRTFAKMLKAMDDAIGDVLAKIRNEDLEEDTLIFFLGDNGGPTQETSSSNLPFRGAKAQVYEGGIRVPFLAQWIGRLPSGKIYDKPVISLDILPTAVTAAGGKVAANVEGANLLPYLGIDKSGDPHEALFWRFAHRRAARIGDWKLVHQDAGGRTELFNLATDPGEKTDVASKHRDKLQELEAAYKEWNSRNIAPLWEGTGGGRDPQG